MSTDTKLGQLITDPAARRDAIHIAIAPVVAGHIMLPGAHVGLNEYGKAVMPVRGSPSPIGIVDPFLEATVKEGQIFWLCLYQQTVTGMRHHWSHPAFVDAKPAPLSEMDKAKAIVAEMANVAGIDYETMMDAADNWVATYKKGSGAWGSGEYLNLGGLLEGHSVPELFWTHYKTITGKTGEGSFFTCSC